MNMMHRNGCGCFHHKLAGLFIVVIWLAAVGYYYVFFSATALWGFDTESLFQTIVILSLLNWGMRACKCCGGHGIRKMEDGMCQHEQGCRCGDCPRCR